MKAIVIIANGWHAGWLGCYGNEWLRTHNLDRLAAECVVFDQHFAVEPTPAGWFGSFATGRYPLTAGSAGREGAPFPLRQYGIRAVRVHDLKGDSPANETLTWDETIAVPKAAGAAPGEAIYLQIDDTLQRLDKVEDWLLWIETDRFVPPWDVSMDFFDEYSQDMAFLEEGEEPHPWDEPPLGPRDVGDRDFERLQTTFASIVTEWDAELAEWLELFREHHLDETAIWAVTSGYGLSLGEHGWIGPSGQRPYEELGHVPLLLRLPRAEQEGRRVASLTASIDLLPTLVDGFGIPASSEVHGKSLLPLARGQREPIHSHVCQVLSADERDEWVIRSPEWACFQSSSLPPLLFRKPEDRWEVNNVRQGHLEWAEYLEAILTGHRADPDTSTPLKPYHEVITNKTEEHEHEHRSPGERNDGPPQSTGSLRGHQSDKED